MAEIVVTPLNTKGTLEDIIAELRKANTRLNRDYDDLKKAAHQLLTEKNQRIEKLEREAEADQAWIKVAVESNQAVDKYLRSVDPSLPKHYGMPVDGVRRVIQTLQTELEAERNRNRPVAIKSTSCADDATLKEPSENPDSGYDGYADSIQPYP